MGRFIVIVLDGFGIGYSDDVKVVRPQDFGANTFKHILMKVPQLKLPTLEKLGVMNALGSESGGMKYSSNALYGISNLMHFGADTFQGHQEIMGTKPKKPKIQPFSAVIDKVYSALAREGYKVEYLGNKIKFLLVNECVTIGDNLEADLGQIYNLTAALDLIDYEEVLNIGRVVRKEVDVSRVIPFGGKNVSIDQILNAVEEKEDKYIGINAPRSGVYNETYQVIHLGYGVNPSTQVPTILGEAGVHVVLLGKVADIVENKQGESISCVDTEQVLKLTLDAMKKIETGFICTNVQETDLSGHAEDPYRYADRLLIADKYIEEIIKFMNEDDILVIMADHGNDPTIGHSHHTREKVPLLVHGSRVNKGFIGYRDTLSDVGATTLEYFNLKGIENGRSFLNIIKI